MLKREKTNKKNPKKTLFAKNQAERYKKKKLKNISRYYSDINGDLLRRTSVVPNLFFLWPSGCYERKISVLIKSILIHSNYISE